MKEHLELAGQGGDEEGVENVLGRRNIQCRVLLKREALDVFELLKINLFGWNAGGRGRVA